jgi:NAD-dependent SIR2 family protein deacetylase
MFSSSFNISDVVEKKSNLRHVSQTTITHLDGSRYIQNNQNGSLSELASGSKDEDGQWAVLDEASALGLSAAEEEKKTSSSSSSSSSDDDANNAILVELLKKHPELSQYLNFIKVGVPTHAIKSKLIEGNVNNKIPQNDIESFLQAIGATGFSDNCCLDAAVGESKDVLFQQSSPVGKPLKGDFSELHGHLGNPSWDAPTLASYSNTPARAGYNTEKSHEYLDSPQVLKEKVKLLASMLVKASKPVIYAGAGLSTASGIGDYATQTGKSGVLAQNGHKGANVSPFCVSPNFGHHCIAALSKRGLVHRFVQQNHDGLPQKAGMSQGLINEIHGGWFDPSNPVVAMSGNLRTDLFDDLLRLERETDLVIAVGSSLCGMNADRLVSTSALKARTYRERMALKKSSSSSNLKEEFGSVIISLQKTVHDHNSSLRIFALRDDVFKL